jgi:hypothetical protein
MDDQRHVLSNPDRVQERVEEVAVAGEGVAALVVVGELRGVAHADEVGREAPAEPSSSGSTSRHR